MSLFGKNKPIKWTDEEIAKSDAAQRAVWECMIKATGKICLPIANVVKLPEPDVWIEFHRCTAESGRARFAVPAATKIRHRTIGKEVIWEYLM